MIKGMVGLLLGKENLLDHLGVFCHLYDIPLKAFDPSLITVAETWYPKLKVEYSDFSPHDLNPSMYPWILSGTLSSIEPIRAAQRQLFGKTSLFAYLPHGISAKSREWKIDEMPKIDLFLFPGKALEELLQECNLGACYHSSLYTGDFRSAYFDEHESFYRELLSKQYPKREATLPSLLLMPSCSNRDSSSFFFDLTMPLLMRLKEKFSLTLKPHPLLEEERPGFYWQLRELCHEARIGFMEKTPPVLPSLEKNSLLVTDNSSVVFDGLVKGSKMILLRKISSLDRYDLSDHARQIDSLESILDQDFAIEPFDLHFQEEKVRWLYEPLLKKEELQRRLEATL